MKEATDSEYTISKKLAYETGARRGLEAEFEVVLKSLQSDQIIIAWYEVELNDLKGAANYAMDCIAFLAEGEEPQSVVDRLIDTPSRLLTLLRAMSLEAATDVLVRVNSHYPNVDMAKVKGRTDTTKDLKALELEVEDVALEVIDNIDYEGDDGDQYSWARSYTCPSSHGCKQCFINTLLSLNEVLALCLCELGLSCR
jgi:hypothetical protein